MALCHIRTLVGRRINKGYTIHRHRGTGFSVRTRRNVMNRPMFFHPSHHIFNLQKFSLHRPPLVKATFTVKGIKFSGVAMLDSGCSTYILPIFRLPKEAKKHGTHSDVHIKGINGSITALGELHCNINVGNCDLPIFEDIKVLVTTQDTPILIGQNILVHNTLSSYVNDNQNATVEFRRTLTSGYTVHTAPINPALTSPHGPAYGVLTIHNNNQPTIGPQPNIQTLDQKLNCWNEVCVHRYQITQTVMNWKLQQTYSFVTLALSVPKTASKVHLSELSV